MIGNSHNKKNSKSGQVLLIAIMIIATILTVVMATVFRSQTDTRTTKLEEDSQQAFAAAEAALEAALSSQTTGAVIIGTGSLSNFSNTGIGGSSECVTSLTDTQFVTPLIQKDQQYTFYLSDYTSQVLNTNSYWNSSGTKRLTFYFDSEVGQHTAIELSFHTKTGATYGIIRYLLDPQNLFTKDSNDTSANIPTLASPNVVKGFSFSEQSNSFNPPNNTYLMFIRVLGGAGVSTRVAIDGGGAIPSQGRTCTSTAVTLTQVQKEIVLFQSYPQIPSSFYVTSF